MAGARNTINVPIAGSPRFERDTVLAISRLKASMMSPSSAPTFQGLTLTGLTASQLVATDADKAMQSIAVGTGLDMSAGTLSFSHLGLEDLTDPGGDRVFFWDDSEDKSDWLSLGNSLAITTTTLDTIQDIRTSASPTFTGITLSGLTASRLMATNGSKAASSADLNSWVTGTANRVTVTDDGDGTITLSGPQDIHAAGSPTFAGITITNAAVLGSNSVVFQPSADSTSFLQVLDSSSDVVVNVNTTNNRFSLGEYYTSARATRMFNVIGSNALAKIWRIHDGNYASGFDLVASPTSTPDTYYTYFEFLAGGYAPGGSTQSNQFVIYDVVNGAYRFLMDNSGSIYVGGFTAPSEKLHVNGKIRSDSAFNLSGSDGLSGTLTLDDGANWRITLTFSGGILTGQTTAASSAATASWA